MPTPDPHPSSHARRSAAATFVAVLIVGAIGTLANPALLRPPDAPWRDGGWARAYQASLDAASPLRPWAAALWNLVDLRLFRQAPAGVVLGDAGWLFTAEEYARPIHPAARAAWVDHVAEVGDRLEAAGVTLVVALVPAKSGQMPAGQPPLPHLAADRYAWALQALHARGVDAVDLRPALADLGASAWLRTDTHWTPAGATAVAGALAEHLRRTLPTLGGGAPGAVEPAGTEAHAGDLLRLLELGVFAERFGPPPDRLERERVVLSAPGGDLFAEVRLPLTVVGTSYSADPRWNLAERLEALLGVGVLDAAEVGRGPAAPMAAYLEGAAYDGARPRAVVWEIPERYLDTLDPAAAP
jgi:alginate O-acetyltransferase complex protein AlgJ